VSKIKNKTKVISSIKIAEEHIIDPNLIADHIVSYYKCLFSSNTVLQEQLLVEEVIPNLIYSSTNNLLTNIPSKEEIKHAVFDLNSDGAPSLDGFGACFFQSYWDIVHKEVENAVLEFFTTGWLLPNFNANTIILIPKSPDADSIDNYRPIALANFKFKIISKILADRLAKILPNIISKEQRGFIKGRNIKACISLTSEAINLLDKKCFGGNLALKIDVSKAFDTLRWDFLIKVLKCFAFNNIFCDWIQAILHSTKISISIKLPSKATLVWRLMLGKLPTDDMLAQRGCCLPSICSLCQSYAETQLHLFFDFPYALKMWNWLAATLDTSLHFQSLEDIWNLANRFSNKQCKVVVNAALVFTINAIWYARNQMRFNNYKIPWKSAISSITYNVNLTGNCTQSTCLSMSDFILLKKFNITLHPPKAHVIKEVF